MLEAPKASVGEGETVTLNFAYDISAVCNVGETYVLLFAKTEGSETSFLSPSPDKPYYFKVVGLKSGVDALVDDSEPVKTEYFDLTGCKVENPDKGRMLIKKSTYPSGETTVNKVIY